MSGSLHRDSDSYGPPERDHRRRNTASTGRCDHEDSRLVGTGLWVCPDCELTWRSAQ